VSFECTEITLDIPFGRYNVRVWIGTDGLVSDEAMTSKAMEAVQRVEARPSYDFPSARELLEHVVSVVPDLNAVQVKTRYAGELFEPGLMVYTQPFTNNDRERFARS
jgi:hypothetical protein